MLTDYEIQALTLSLKIAGTSALINLPFAIFFALILARKQFWGKSWLDAFIHLPLILPPVVIGYLLLVIMGSQGLIGKWLNTYFHISFSFNWLGAVLAVSVISFPLMVRAIRLAIEAVDPRLENAARTLGANKYRVFFTITLPLTLPGILTGTVLAFARALGEFGATITFVSNIAGQTRTIPLAMYTFIETPGAEDKAMRLCIISITIAIISLLLSEWLAKQVKKRTTGYD